MLTLEPPLFEFAGVTVFRDHAVPTQFYFAAPNPRIAREGGRVIFDLMTYAVDLKHSVLSGTAIPEELGAGFLTMATECLLSPAQRSAILSGLGDATGLSEEAIQLFPIPYHKGKVSVIALDRFQTPGEEPADPASESRLQGRPTFVEEVLGSGNPSLLGHLRSIFSLSLSQNGAAFLKGLYADGAAPVGVVYDLSFYGMRPAVKARVRADLSRVYKHFGGGLSVQYKWIKAEVQGALEYLREQRAIEVELTSEIAGEAGEKAKERAMALFREDIVQNLFRPTATGAGGAAGMGAAAGMGGVAGAGGAAGTTAGGTGGSGGAISLTLQFKRQEELKSAVYDYTERSPEERTHAPQGFLPLLLSPAELERRTHHVSLGSPFFELLEVLVSGPPKEDFDALGIRQVEAELTYGEEGTAPGVETQTVLFRPDSTGDKTVAFQRNGRESLAYRVALAYDFVRGGADADTARYELPPATRTGRSLAVNPTADFGALEVDVELGRIHPDVRSVDVDLSYESPDGRFIATERFRLEPGAESPAVSHWLVRTRSPEVGPYRAVATFLFDDGSWTAPPLASSERLLEIDTPFAGERELTIKPVLPSGATVEHFTVEIEYDDEEAGYHRRKRVRIDPPFETARVAWPIVDRNRQTLRYRVTVQEPGRVSEGDWQTEEGASITIGAEAHKVGRVKLQLIGPTLEAAGLDGVQVRLLAAADGAPAPAPDEAVNVLFSGERTDETIDLSLPPGAPLRYRYQTVSFHKDGTMKESPWKEAGTTLLILQVVNL